jgi:ParB-like chromosome segregation protein Spo0J
MSDELRFHPLADIFPLMEGEDFNNLVADIKANGLHEPIVLFRGMILDGRNRYRALQRLGITTEDRWKDFYLSKLDDVCVGVGGETDFPKRARNKDALAYVISKNIHRRHLTAEQRREVIAKLIKAQPQKSNRQIAKAARADDKTVGAVRRKLESTAEIPQLKKRTGADGKARKQPAKAVGANERTVRRDRGAADAAKSAASAAPVYDDFLDDRGSFAAIDREADIACRIRGLLYRAQQSTFAAEEELEEFNELVCTEETRGAVTKAAEAWAALSRKMNRRAPVEDGGVSKPQPSIAAPSHEPAPAVDPWDRLDIPDYLRRVPKAVT